ncbi:hypothetical protein JCM10213_000914 [Rhodosporidiobolus nylandii]
MSSVASSSLAARTSRGGGARGASSGGDDGASVASEQREEEWEGGEDDDDDEPAQPVKKKARKAAPKGKGKGKGKGKLAKKDEGKLKKLLELPVDILIEIAGHLDPLTLLNFTRVNKSFRAIFTSRSSKSAWHAARKTLALPDLEAEVFSEMAYASLLFEKECHVCGKVGAKIVNVDVRHRFCKPCQRDKPASSRIRYGPHKRTYTIPDFGYSADVRALNAQLVTLQTQSGCPDPCWDDDGLTMYKKLAAKKKRVEEGEAEFKPEEKELEAFVTARRALLADIQADAEVLKLWLKDSSTGRGQAIQEAKQQRRKAIESKLEGLGYDMQDLDILDPEIEKLILQPRPLTDTIWARISADIIKHVEENRELRLKHERYVEERQHKEALQPYFNSMKLEYDANKSADGVPFPSFATFVGLEAVKPFWSSQPPVALSVESWCAVAAEVLEQAKSVREQFKLKLAQHVAAVLEGMPQAVEPSLLGKLVSSSTATSSLDDDLASLFAPLVHWPTCGACSAVYRFSRQPMALSKLIEHCKQYDHSLATLNPEPLKWFNPGWAALASHALSLVGLDDSTSGEAGYDALHAHGKHRWVCEDCPSFEAELARAQEVESMFGTGRTIDSVVWLELVYHVFERHFIPSPNGPVPSVALVPDKG